jgi:hypothetical protein
VRCGGGDEYETLLRFCDLWMENSLQMVDIAEAYWGYVMCGYERR